MKQFRSVTLIIFVLILVVGIAVGQNRSRTKPKPAPRATATPITPAPSKRMVTIHFKQGERVLGAFLQADADTVQIEAQQGRLTLKLSEIASMVFAPAETARASAPVTETPPASAAPPSQTAPAVQKAYTTLRKLADAVKIGLPYLHYNTLLIEVKSSVEEALAPLPENALKAELTQALAAYTEAGQAWSAMQATGVLPIATEPGATLIKKYAIKPSVNALGEADHLRLDVTLGAIWTAAAKHLDNAALMLKAS